MHMQVQGSHATRGALVHLHPMLDLLPAGACVCDARGRITHCTPKAVALWGCQPTRDDDTPRWSGAVQLFDEEGRPMPHNASPLARAVADGVAHHGRRVQLARPDGSRRHALSYASPLIDDNGEVVGGLDLLVDVTEQYRVAKAERDRVRAQGEQLVALACEIRASLTPLRRPDREVSAPAFDDQLRHITRLVDRVLNLEVDAD
ncbi:PAS domain-containing protein [Lysobacter claricitrinus]|uniref:PAS domain-containing protein n=1 Tax=Lysobacter claricitrinus TaxID=3367728 RepID=UPI0037DADC87